MGLLSYKIVYTNDQDEAVIERIEMNSFSQAQDECIKRAKEAGGEYMSCEYIPRSGDGNYENYSHF